MNDRLRFRAFHKPTKKMFEVFCFTDKEVFENTIDGVGATPTNPANIDDCVLMQCTGLKDKNGNLIYEGDILDFDLSIPKNGGHYRGIVYWQTQNNLIGWMISSLKHTGSWDIRQIAHPNDWMTWAEVIGNIHENPELMEDK